MPLYRRNVPYKRQKEIPITYKGINSDYAYRLDVVVPNQLIVELKACESLEPIHEAQLLTYLKLSGIKVGLLINFNVLTLKEVSGLKGRQRTALANFQV